MDFDLYQIIVEQLVGGLFLSILVMVVLLFILMAVIGRMSRMTVIYYLALFIMTMTIGFGYRILTILIGAVLLIWLYLEVRDSTSG